jgi:hypothetical protein
MVATLLFMHADTDTPPLCAPPSPSHEDVLTAQKDALTAQQNAEKAQIKAIALQADTRAQIGSDGFVDEAKAAAARLKEACEEVSAVEEKLIKHALK